MRSLATFTLLAASLTAADSNRFKDEFRYNFTVNNGARIDLNSFNGSVEIVGWDQNNIEITGAKYAAEAADLAKVQVEAVQEGTTVRIRATRPKEGNSGWRCNCGARFTIRAPRRTELASIRTSNGQLRVESIDAPVNVQTSNGGMKLYQLKGKLDARTSNGSIDLQGVEGGATLETSNGSVTLEGVRGSLRASTSNGSIKGRLVDTVTSDPIHLSTSNGSIDLRIETPRNNDITATTSNGSLTIRMPETANARISASTSSHESVTTDFPIMVRGTLSKNKLEGSLGNGGGPTVRLETSNGPIRLLRL